MINPGAASRWPSRIALVSSHYPPSIGGLERHVSALGAVIAELGVSVDVLVPQLPEPRTAVLPIGPIEQPGVSIRRFSVVPGGGRFSLSLSLWQHLRRTADRYDLIHAHNLHAFPILAAACSSASSLIVTPHYHGSGHSRISQISQSPHRRVARLILDRADAVICVSDAEASLMASHFPGFTQKIAVIHNGVDFEGLRDARRPDQRDHLVLTAGRLERYKRVDLLVDAMQFVPSPWRLAVIGLGRDRRRLEQLVHARRLGERISFIDPVSEESFQRWLGRATAYVSMSEHESFGLALAEAAAAGAGLIASDIPPHREVVKLLHAERSELLSKLCGPRALAQAILRSGPQPEHQTRDVDLSWQRMAEETLALYAKTIHGRSRSRGVCRAQTADGARGRLHHASERRLP